ncbi:type IV secretion system DNA-binding domain-containing protein [Spiroplasma endosymbiont of 'Nebria riversi']|uniref:type IV secretion system DNA-binding domain-containing protein n=1 Tax=Spiroplasma endosymbiont of 'Nebria riversi' TaxID=2792084 RepID=UPI001C0574B5|nr:type IV secretion system DNA-binding domain-containing protein [Spiroplasma endosymbiont of 'Nebria riversi']
MNKIKQWFKKLNKFEKIILLSFSIILAFIFFITLINIIVAFAYAGIKLKEVAWNNFAKAFAKDISLKISTIIATIIIFIFTGFIGYQKWKHFNMFAYEQKKKANILEQEFKQIPQNNLVKLNNDIGLIKFNLNQHTLLIGTTGSGKTTTLLQIVKELRVKFRETTIIIDGKGDIDLINKVKKLDPNAFIWEINGITEYNPFANKDKVILADKMMSLFEFSEQYYQNLAHNYLLLLLDILLANNIAVTFDNLVNYFPIKKLEKLINFNSDKISLLSDFEEKEINGLYNQLNVYNTQLNDSLGKNNSLLDLISNYKTILFSINSLMYPKLSGGVGKIIIQDLKELTALKPINQKINIVLDEFNVFANETIINLINKSRAFNYQCFLSFQTINDLKTKNMNLTDTIFGNVSNIICHNVKDPNTAEYVANVFGTKETEKLTRQIDFQNSTANMGSVRSVDEFIVHPNDLKTLKIGECYFKTALPSGKLFIKKIQILLIN